jgi:hypothetical protein
MTSQSTAGETSTARPCVRCHSPCEVEDIRCPVCAVALAVNEAHIAEPRAQILRCEDCGAALKYSAEQQGVKCAFCGSKLKLETPADPVEQAKFAVPFQVSPQQAHGVLHQWLGRQGFFTPSDLQRAAQLESLRPLWWAAWLVDARTLVSWAADSDAGSGRSDWAPHAGQTAMTFERLVVSASRGLTYEETSRLTAHTNIAGAQLGYSEQSGATIEQFDAQRSAARKAVVSAIEATAAGQVQAGVIPGSRFRNVHVSVLLEGLTTRRFLLPAYVLAYRYDGKLYRAIVHGQDAGCVFGSVPRSIWKILLVVVGALAVVGIVVAVMAIAGR